MFSVNAGCAAWAGTSANRLPDGVVRTHAHPSRVPGQAREQATSPVGWAAHQITYSTGVVMAKPAYESADPRLA